jgi:stage II sporulation protein AA (anti-sigma F factor antagonist)
LGLTIPLTPFGAFLVNFLKKDARNMQVSSRRVEGVLLLHLEGQINGNNATSLEQELKASIEQERHGIALDFTEVDYISSAGLRVVLWLSKQLLQRDRSGALALYGLRENVMGIFEMCGFTDILTIVESQEEALEKIKSALA